MLFAIDSIISHPIEGLGAIKLCKSLGPDKTFCNTWVNNLAIAKGTQPSQSDWGNVTLSALQSISPGHELQADVARSHEVPCRQWLMRSTMMVHESWYIWVLDDVRLWDIEVIFNVTFEIRLAQKLLCNVFLYYCNLKLALWEPPYENQTHYWITISWNVFRLCGLPQAEYNQSGPLANFARYGIIAPLVAQLLSDVLKENCWMAKG